MNIKKIVEKLSRYEKTKKYTELSSVEAHLEQMPENIDIDLYHSEGIVPLTTQVLSATMNPKEAKDYIHKKLYYSNRNPGTYRVKTHKKTGNEKHTIYLQSQSVEAVAKGKEILSKPWDHIWLSYSMKK